MTRNSKTEDAAPAKSGKVVRNERGVASWAINLPDGSASINEDTQAVLKALDNSELALGDTYVKKQAPIADPYNKGLAKREENTPRKSINDLRKLSQEIVSTKVYQRPTK